MAERKSKLGGAIVASVLISAIVTGGLMYFVTPLLFPGVSKGALQTKTLTLNSDAYIEDSSTASYLLMDSTTLTMTTSGGTIIDARFSDTGIISLDTTFTGSASFFVALVVEGVGNRTIIAHYFDSTPTATGYNREISVNLDIEYATGTLPAGTYTISVMWISRGNAAGTNYLQAITNTLETPRVLVVQEIAP